MSNQKNRHRIVGLDTLKLIAIILIVIYHCFPSVLPGGFLAVDIFFVVSGFLIGKKLLRLKNQEGDRFGGFKSFLRFVGDRLKRFLPTLLFCMIIALSLAYFADPDLLTAARQNSLFAVTFSTNIASIITGSTYENSLIPNLFNQTWFLALELQVCIIIFFVLSCFFGIFKTKKTNDKRMLTGLFVLCGAISIFSFILMCIYGGWFELYDRAYFGPDSHIGAFFLGASLAMFTAFKTINPATKHRFISWTLLILSLAGIIAMTPFIRYASKEAFLLGLPLTSFLSVFVVYLILKLQSTNQRSPRILKILEYLGKLSFPVYLLHWSLYIVLPSLLNFWPLEIIPYIVIVSSILLSILLQKIILPFSKKHKVIFLILLLLSFILPIMSLVKAPEKSSIEQNLAEAAEQNPVEPLGTNNIAVDYSKTNSLGLLLNTNVMQFFDASEDFAKPYPVTTYGGGWWPAGGGGWRAGFNDPDYSRTSALSSARVMVLGDSVVLGAWANIENTIPGSFVDAMGSRNMTDAIGLLAGYRAANGGNLPYIIVIGLVTNYYPFSAGTIQEIMDTAGPGHQFVFMTGYCGDYSREAQNEILWWMASNYSNVHVGDWVSVVAPNVDWYTYADHTHLTPDGRQAYANLINQVVSGL